MCCNAVKILILLSMIALSYTFNIYIPNIAVVIWFFISINFFTFLLFGIDKISAIKQKKRAPQQLLYFLSIAGGVVGALLGMFVFRHKIKKDKFMIIHICILILWIIATYFILNNFDKIQIFLQNLSA